MSSRAQQVPRREAHVQTLRSVTSAETRKLLARGGVRRWVIAAGVLGLASGVGTVLLAQVETLRAVAAPAFADVASSGPVTVAVVLSLAAANYVPREISDGTVMTSRFLVPRTRLLFAARMLAWGVLVAGLGLVTALVPLPVALMTAHVAASSPAELIAAIVLSLVLATALVGLAHAGAALLQRGAFIVAVGMTVLFVLPLLVGLGGTVASGTLAAVLRGFGTVVLGTLLFTALQMPSGDHASWAVWTRSAIGVAVWSVVTTYLAFRTFRRTGYGDR